MKRSVLFLLLSITVAASSQIPDHVYKSNIRSIRLHSGEDLDLYFDDLDGDIKYYYYTFQLCNADWSPNTELRTFDYLRGFLSNRIATYRNSSIAFVKYTNYY